MLRKTVFFVALFLGWSAGAMAQNAAGKTDVSGSSAKFGDLAVEATKVVQSVRGSSGRATFTYWVSVTNGGNAIHCGSLTSRLKAASQSQYQTASYNPPDLRSLSAGQQAEGTFSFDVPVDTKPQTLVLDLGGLDNCSPPENNALSSGEVELDVHALPGTGQMSQAPGGPSKATQPACISCPTPSYPKDALKSGFEGTVEIEVVIQPNGTATDMKVTQPSGVESVDNAAVAAVQKWRFSPALDANGTAIAARTRISVEFLLHRPQP